MPYEDNEEDMRKTCNLLMDFFEMNQVPKGRAILSMWNIMIMTWKGVFGYDWKTIESLLKDLMERTKHNFDKHE